MTNSKQLHYEAGRIFQKSQAKVGEANKAMAKSESYVKAGDTTRANAEINIANKLYEEAIRLEKLAMKYDNEAANLETEALQIEDQVSRLHQVFSYQIEKLEHRQKMLRGQI